MISIEKMKEYYNLKYWNLDRIKNLLDLKKITEDEYKEIISEENKKDGNKISNKPNNRRRRNG